jgi:hypothetical protein
VKPKDDTKEQRYEKFLKSKERLSEDQTLSSNARCVADFLCRGIESADDIPEAFRLGKLIRGGKYRDELHLSGDELQAALNELDEGNYHDLFI